MLRVKEFNSAEDFAGLRAVWAELLAATLDATFFQSLEWLQTYWQHFGPPANLLATNGHPERLRILLVEDAGKPIGILPLVVATEHYRVGYLRVLGYPLAGWGSFYAPIGPQPATTLSAGLKHICNTMRDWDLLDLRWVDEQVDHGDTPHALQTAGFKFSKLVWHQSAQVESQHGWESYWASRTSRWRNNVGRCERLLAHRGTLEYVRYRPLGAAQGDANPRWDLYDTCVELARRSWQGSSTTGTTLSHESVQKYLRDAHESATRAGAFDLNLLLLDSKPVAYSYNYHYRGRVYGLRSGYDPAAVHEGAGTVLMRKMIEDSCRRNDRLLDLGPNYLECKRYWYTRLQPAYHYTHYRPTRLRVQALRMKQIVKQWLGRTKPTAEIANQMTEL